jgi:3-oxoacyl-[acyl-carrier protein] reductase
MDDLVLITGASGGIGSASVVAFLAAGYHVAGIDIASAVQACPTKANSNSYKGFVVDHRDELSVNDALVEIAKFGNCRHLILCAGVGLDEELKLDAGRKLPNAEIFRASIELNLLGHVNVLRAAEPYLFASSGDKSVAFCSSVNALQGFGMPAYASAKAGLIGLMHALTVSYGAKGVRINTVAPGTTPTEKTRQQWAHEPDHFPEMEKGMAIGRLGTPDDVAKTFLSLARDLTHITGQVIVVDGGQTIMR